MLLSCSISLASARQVRSIPNSKKKPTFVRPLADTCPSRRAHGYFLNHDDATVNESKKAPTPQSLESLCLRGFRDWEVNHGDTNCQG